MKTINNLIIISLLALMISFAGCKKDNSSTTPDPSVQSTALLKNYQDASKFDASLVTYHQHALVNGIHDSCYIYWHQFQGCDSLFSEHFYEYCREIYASNGGTNYSHDGWHWNEDHGGMMDHGSWQCGLDTLQFESWHGTGDFIQHDSQMHTMMQGYNMTGYFSSQANQSYSEMMTLRDDHYINHNYHW
jgi:hypothetical protein